MIRHVVPALLLLVAGTSGPVTSAPVPRPLPWSDEYMVGRWEFTWGPLLRGWIVFRDDGTFAAQTNNLLTCGDWWTERGGVVQLVEWEVFANAPAQGPRRLTITLTPGTMSGRSSSGSDVTLTRVR